MKEKIFEFYRTHITEINGAFIGLLFSILVLAIGVFRTVFVVAFVISGYYLGKRLSRDKEYLKNLLDRILPPGTYR
jgi:uncharacterized membrane protein